MIVYVVIEHDFVPRVFLRASFRKWVSVQLRDGDTSFEPFSDEGDIDPATTETVMRKLDEDETVRLYDMADNVDWSYRISREEVG